MTTDELRAKFRAVMSVRHPFWSYAFRADGCGVHDDYMDPWVECAWQAFKAAHASRDAEVEALRDLLLDRDATIEMREHEVEASRKDVERVNHLALHPRGAKIVIAGMPRDCIFWGISSAPCYTLREAIDAEMQEKQP